MLNGGRGSISEHFYLLYAKAPVPVAFLDPELLLEWANDAALAIHPSLSNKDGFFLLMPNQYTSSLHGLTSATGLDPLEFYLPFVHRHVALLPIMQEQELAGYLMHSYPVAPTAGSALRPEGMEKLLSSFSDQFRNPLSNIFSTLSVLRSTPVVEAAPDVGELLQNINAQSYKILRSSMLISDYIRYQSPLDPADKKVIDLSHFLQELCSAANIVTGHIGIPVAYHAPGQSILLSCEPKRLTHAILHLFANSCRFTREGNSIDVSLQQIDSNAVITVSDSGLGIPSSQLEMVFDPFFSYDTFGTPFAGLGLGLTVFKYIVEQHSGTVAIVSEEDVGTRVVFTLPIGGDSNLSLHDSPSVTDYLYDRFSSVYVLLSDSCAPPKP